MKVKEILLVTVMALTLSSCWTLETGEKTGRIVKVAKAGYIVKTWDGELVKGGFTDGSGSMGKTLNFSIESEDLVEKLKSAMETQRQVNVKYHQEFFAFLRTNYEDHYFVDAVEIL